MRSCIIIKTNRLVAKIEWYKALDAIFRLKKGIITVRGTVQSIFNLYLRSSQREFIPGSYATNYTNTIIVGCL